MWAERSKFSVSLLHTHFLSNPEHQWQWAEDISHCKHIGHCKHIAEVMSAEFHCPPSPQADLWHSPTPQSQLERSIPIPNVCTSDTEGVWELAGSAWQSSPVELNWMTLQCTQQGSPGSTGPHTPKWWHQVLQSHCSESCAICPSGCEHRLLDMPASHGCQSNPWATACVRDRTMSRWPWILRNCTERTKLSSPLPHQQWGRSSFCSILPTPCHLPSLTTPLLTMPPHHSGELAVILLPPKWYCLSPLLYCPPKVLLTLLLPLLPSVFLSSLQPPICHPDQAQASNHCSQHTVPFFQTSSTCLFLPSYSKVTLLNLPFQMLMCLFSCHSSLQYPSFFFTNSASLDPLLSHLFYCSLCPPVLAPTPHSTLVAYSPTL